MSEPRIDFSFIVRDNEAACERALAEQNYVQAYLLMHALIESLLRAFLHRHSSDSSFHALIRAYEGFLTEQHLPPIFVAEQQHLQPTFVKELIKFNQQRNRIVHQLWRKGFSFTNMHAEPAARAAAMMYGLLIEWLQTFQPEITALGFEYDDGV
ncbi:MAG: hypothetical protein M3O35_08065 [Acidobacteriota bacterium]|nr:hypothetical protein [Acidobacteriota bacterium]